MPKDIDKFSSGLGGTIIKLYKVGGLMLVFVFLGALLTLGGNFFGGEHSGFIVTFGAIMTFACLVLYALPQVVAAKAGRQARDFSERIAGNWWERVTPAQGTALSWISLRVNLATGTVVLNGRAFDNHGAEFAKWDSVGGSVDAEQGKIFYHWQGYQVSAPEVRYEGFGEVTFRETGDRIDHGDGVFFDARLGAGNFTTKSSRFRRSTDPAEEKAVEEGTNRATTAALIEKKLKEF
jgi:hypothetical protein